MKKVVLLVLFTLLFMIGVGVYIVQQPVPLWAEEKILQVIEKQIEKYPEVKINKVHLTTTLWDALWQKSLQLELAAKIYGFEVLAKGGLAYNLDTEVWKIQFSPNVKIQSSIPGLDISPFHMDLRLALNETDKEIRSLSLELKVDQVIWENLQIEGLRISGETDLKTWNIESELQRFTQRGEWIFSGEDHKLVLRYRDFILNARASLKELSMKDRKEERIIRLVDPQIEMNTAVTMAGHILQPIEIGFKAASSEMLWMSNYLNLPLDVLSLQSTISLQNYIPKLVKLDLSLFSKYHILLSAAVNQKLYSLGWKVKQLPLTAVVQLLNKITSFSSLENIIFENGFVNSSGQVIYNSASKSLYRAFDKLKADLRLNDVNMRLRPPGILLTGLNFHLPLSFSQSESGQFSIDKINFKRFVGKLGATNLDFNLKAQDLFKFSLRIKDNLPLRIEPVNYEVGGIDFVGQYDEQGFSYDFRTSLKVPEQELSPTLGALCIKSQLIPPMKFAANYPLISMNTNEAIFEGQARAELFSGFIELRDLKIFRLLSVLPETQFNMEWDNIQLGSIGEWYNLGKIDGELRGHSLGTVMQGLLPTQYNFLFAASPNRSGEIIFSPRAMGNVVMMVTPDDYRARIPGFMDWLVFGFPSEIMGGYNVRYAGISLYSHAGSILLQTLDPEEVLQNEKKHFILYGRRVKIPVNSIQYPIVLDAPGVTHFIWNVMEQLARLQTEKKEKKDEDKDCPAY